MTYSKQPVVGVPKETYAGEALVALIPSHVPLLTKLGIHVMVEAGAGEAAGFADEAYRAKGVRIATDRAELFGSADILLQVRTPGANPEKGRDDLRLIRPEQVLIGLAEPLGQPAMASELAHRGATVFAMELMPRIARAQSMDVLSSLATIVGYKAVLLAASTLPKLFPMLTTAAGTIPPARVLVIGAGVAGLQAIATARRLGGVVSAYDVRLAAREEAQSLGAKFIEISVGTDDGGESDGYAKALGEDLYRRQRELLTPVVTASDVVITTASVPGKPAPMLISADMVSRMGRGSVVVDVAAERGGNCELTRPNEVIVHHGVTILGPTNLPSTVPAHASQMYGKNIASFLLHLCRDGSLRVDLADEVTRETLLTRNGEVVNSRVRTMIRDTHHEGVGERKR
ncbi:Re/Si-specific NAD(P)(+) transhydrogenase subunit alpha [Petrachloros mirabilis]